jgi:hypothetical protein
MHDHRGHPPVPVAKLLAVLLAASSCVLGCGIASPASPAATASGAPSTPSVTAEPTATEPVEAEPTGESTDTPVATAASVACTAADLKASHGLVEGGAGSRLTEVVLVSGAACSVDAFPILGLRDADGNALVAGPQGGPGQVDLVPGTAYTSVVKLGNWCSAEPAYPVSLEIRLQSGELAVTGGSFPAEGDMPPCNGDGGAILGGGAWTASP